MTGLRIACTQSYKALYSKGRHSFNIFECLLYYRKCPWHTGNTAVIKREKGNSQFFGAHIFVGRSIQMHKHI
jgi:hypothetical protein